jgi:peroxiredoxin
VQKRFGTPDRPSIAFCPNCHVRITPGTQICSNCNSRICTHCYQVIPSLTANVCPKCGKRDILTKSLKEIRMESALKHQTTESFITETEYNCPICHERMVLLSGGTLKCQSRSCGYIIDLKEYLSTYGDQKKAPAPPTDTFGVDVTPPKGKTQPKFFEVAKSKVWEKMDSEDSTAWQDLTTSIETKAKDQYFWKSEKLGSRRAGSSDRGKGNSAWESKVSREKISINIPWRKVGIAARFIGLIAAVALVGFGIYTGVRALINADIFNNVSISAPAINNDLVIASLHYDGISDEGVNITWETNIPASSEVEYGISDALGYVTGADSELTTEHMVTINGLEPETTYYFVATAKSKNDQQVVHSEIGTFTTLVPPDNTAPVISDVNPSDVSDIDASITWKTDEASTAKVEYGTSSSKYTYSTDISADMKTDHYLKLTGLSPSTTYHFIVKSADASNNEAVSKDYSFHTSASIPEGTDIGDRAPDFNLPVLDGDSVTLSQYRGKIVLVNFWFTSCGACLGELPYIEEIKNTWTGNEELQVITIDIRDYPTNVKKILTKYGYTFTVLLDTDDTKLWQKYGVTSAPRTFFIDTNGIIRKVQRGSFRDASEIKEILDSM